MRHSLAVLSLTLVACSGAPSDDARSPFDDVRRAFADSARANGVYGAQLAVSVPGLPLWSTEHGEERPGVPMTAEVLLGTGSISKMLAAVAVLRLTDQGRVSMTDTLGRWFPGVPNVSPGITVRQLLWHQSGLADYGADPGVSAAVLANREREWAAEELLPFIGPPAFAPGTAWAASNTDRLLLGIIAARVADLPYGEVLARELFAGGEGAYWTPGQHAPASRTLATHWATDASGARLDYSARVFGPSLFTFRLKTYLSAREMVLFARRLFEGDLLSAEGRRQLLTIVPDDQRIPGQMGGGVGIRRFAYGGRTYYGNSGATTNSSAFYLYDPESRVIVAMSTNEEGNRHGNSHFRIVPALIRLASERSEGR